MPRPLRSIVVVLATTLSIAVVHCGGEPPFIDQCKRDCECTGDSFACRPPKMGGCDNLYRRNHVLANRDGCGGQYDTWFNCVYSKSTCNAAAKTYEPPSGACKAEKDALDSCCSGSKCDG